MTEYRIVQLDEAGRLAGHIAVETYRCDDDIIAAFIDDLEAGLIAIWDGARLVARGLPGMVSAPWPVTGQSAETVFSQAA